MKPPRVLAVAPMPPEKIAYALARYSRSADSIRDSVEWVRTHDSTKFLESFYFQYGHASIADLGHIVLCFEGVSELAATEIEDEQLVGRPGPLLALPGFLALRLRDAARTRRPPPPPTRRRTEVARRLSSIHRHILRHLTEKLPRPDDMKPDAYQRNLAARAFDVARYTLFFGIPDRRRPSHQHPHSGTPDPPSESLRVSLRSASSPKKLPPPAPRPPPALGTRTPPPSLSRPR